MPTAGKLTVFSLEMPRRSMCWDILPSISRFSSPHLVDRYLGRISATSQEHIRQGFALAIASLPSEMLLSSQSINKILDCLFNLVTISTQSQHLIKQRRDTLIALCNLYENVHLHRLSPFAQQELITKFLNAYLRCARDYTNDRLGDSGRLVRETAGTQLVRLLRLIDGNSQSKHFLTSAVLHSCLNAILTNVCSKIDDLRVISGKALIEFLNIPFDAPIENKDALVRIFHEQADLDWRNSQSVFPLIVQLLIYDKYRFIVWLNCLMTAGELNHASQALYNYLVIHRSNDHFLDLLFQDLEKIFRDKQYLQIRVLLPCIQACERLLSQSTFENYYEKNRGQFVQHWSNLLQSLEEILTKKSQALNNNPTLYLPFMKLCCTLLQFTDLHLRSLLIRFLTKFFLHQYPWVRRQAAQNFYDTCIMFSDELFTSSDTDAEDHSEQIMGILTETDWEANLDSLSTIRRTVLDLFHIVEWDVRRSDTAIFFSF